MNNQLSSKDLELVERIVYKNSDDIAISIARCFERMEERIDAMEARLYNRLGDLEDKIVIDEHITKKEIFDRICELRQRLQANDVDALANIVESLTDLETGVLQDCRKN